MIGLQTIAVAFAMFSALPVPQFAWNQKNMRYAMCAFPLIGVVMAAVVPVRRSAPADARKRAGFCLIGLGSRAASTWMAMPDTCDALSSYGDRKKEAGDPQRPHCGAFAVIRLCSYFSAYLALCACVDFPRPGGPVLDTGPCAGTGHLGLAVASFPMAKNTGLAHTFATAADRTTVRRVLMVLAALLSAAPCWHWAAGRWCWRRCWCLHAIMLFQVSSLAASPAIGWMVFAESRAVDAGGAVICQWGGLL